MENSVPATADSGTIRCTDNRRKARVTIHVLMIRRPANMPHRSSRRLDSATTEPYQTRVIMTTPIQPALDRRIRRRVRGLWFAHAGSRPGEPGLTAVVSVGWGIRIISGTPPPDGGRYGTGTRLRISWKICSLSAARPFWRKDLPITRWAKQETTSDLISSGTT